MFLCGLNPSCPLCRSTVDPSWHFSAGTHEAAVSDKTRAFSNNIQTTGLFPLLCLYLCVHSGHYSAFQGHAMFTVHGSRVFSSPLLFFSTCASSKLYMRAANLPGLYWAFTFWQRNLRHYPTWQLPSPVNIALKAMHLTVVMSCVVMWCKWWLESKMSF